MTPPMHQPRLVAGTMTGTSIDALDAALVEIDGAGLAMRPRFIEGLSRPFGPLAEPLRRLAAQEPCSAGRIARLAHDFSRLHGDVLRDLLGGRAADLITVHGQTVYHAPPISWQLIQPSIIAAELRTRVVSDLRAADLACGGQGAPLTPIADYLFFRDRRETRAVVNLGGFCNYTRIPASDQAGASGNEGGSAEDDGGASGDEAARCVAAADLIEGGDICACNLLLDSLARTRLNQPFDDGGSAALRGRADVRALQALVDALRAQRSRRRSLGTHDDVTTIAGECTAALAPQDALRTACRAVALVIAASVGCVDRVIIAGGGVRNAALLADLREACLDGPAELRDPCAASGRRPDTGRSDRGCGGARPCVISTCDELAMPAEYREAAEFAVLGALCDDRVAITLPRITGVRAPAPIAGLWSFGS